MSGICSEHRHHEQGCALCNAAYRLRLPPCNRVSEAPDPRIAALTAQVATLENEREDLCEMVRALNALCDCEGTGWVAIGSKDDPEEPHEKCILPHCVDARALVPRVRGGT